MYVWRVGSYGGAHGPLLISQRPHMITSPHHHLKH